MSLRKVLLILRRRWPVLVVVAVVGLVVGAGLSALRNRGIEPRFEATASVVSVRQSDDNTGRLLAGQLSEYQISAIRVNQSVLESGVAEIRVETGETEGFLLFIGYGPTRDVAREIASSMRSAYLEAAPVGVQAVDQDLTTFAAQVEAIRTEIAEIVAESEVPLETELSASFLSAAINQLRIQAVQLAVDLILFDFREPGRERSEIETELETVQESIVELEAELASLATTPVLPTERDLRVLALSQQESQITQQYLELFLNQAEAAALTSEGPVVVNEVSATPVPLSVAGLGGAFLALLVAAASLFGFDLLRRPIWSIEDLESLPTLGRLSLRESGSPQRHFPWYMHAGTEPRVNDLQAIRASLDRVIDGSSVVIAVAKLGVPAEDHKRFVADLAASYAAVGRSTLLIDAEFGLSSGLPEFGPLHPTLSDLVRAQPEDGDLVAHVKEALGSLPLPMRGLIGLSAGSIPGHTADALAGPAFETVLEVARGLAEVVIVVTSEANHAAALTVAQRVDHMVIAGKAEATRLPEVESALKLLAPQRANVVGVVLLSRGRSSLMDYRGMASGLQSARRAVSRLLRKIFRSA